MFALSHTVSVLEVFWTLENLPGLAGALLMLSLGLGDLAKNRRAGINGLVKSVTLMRIRNNAVRSWTFLVFVLVGVIAMLTPEPVTHAGSLFQYALTFAFVSVGGIMSWDTLIDYWTRREKLAEMERYAEESASLREHNLDHAHPPDDSL